MATSAKEAVFSVNNFKQPKVLEGKDAIATLLVRLIQLEPGTYPSRPTMGVGLLSNYRYCDESKAKYLQTHIREQIATFLPQYQAVNVETKLVASKLFIDITIDQTLYRYEAVQDTDDNKTIIGLDPIMTI